MAETERVQRKVRGSIVGPATKSQVPVLLVNAMAEVQREENAKPRAARLAGTQKKHVAVSAVSTVVDEIDIPEEDRNAVKELLPELVDVIKSLINGKSPALEVFANPENVSAIVRLGKSIRSCFCCGKKQPKESPDNVPVDAEVNPAADAPVEVKPAEDTADAPVEVNPVEDIEPAPEVAPKSSEGSSV